MKYKLNKIIITTLAVGIIIIRMYKFRKKSDFNTDTPVSVEAGILRDNF